MKTLLLLAMLAAPLSASHLTLRSVKQPVYLIGNESDSNIHIIDVPFVSIYADPEWRFSAICKPFTPPSDGSWHDPDDFNLASLYGIKVSGTYVQGTPDVEVIIDASKAKAPETYPFTLDQVIDSVTTCVKLMYRPRPEDEGKLAIKVIQPATRNDGTVPSE